jgi:hypothetical protein
LPAEDLPVRRSVSEALIQDLALGLEPEDGEL